MSVALQREMLFIPVRRWLTSVFVATYVLILWGAVVRRSGSGLGCPDWPLCYGEVIPPFHPATYIEWTHRLLAGVVSLLCIGMLVAVARRAEPRRRLLRMAIITMVLLLIQAGMGGVTVKTELEPLVVAIHLGLAWIFLGCVVVMWQRLRNAANTPTTNDAVVPRATPRAWAWGALLIVFAQGMLGAVVSTSDAGMACPDFPQCQGQWWPPMVGAVALHMGHRLGAIVVLVVVGGLAARMLRESAGRRLGRAILLVLCLQLGLGVANIWFALAFIINVAHLAAGTALFVLLLPAATRNVTCDSTLSPAHQAAH